MIRTIINERHRNHGRRGTSGGELGGGGDGSYGDRGGCRASRCSDESSGGSQKMARRPHRAHGLQRPRTTSGLQRSPAISVAEAGLGANGPQPLMRPRDSWWRMVTRPACGHAVLEGPRAPPHLHAGIARCTLAHRKALSRRRATDTLGPIVMDRPSRPDRQNELVKCLDTAL